MTKKGLCLLAALTWLFLPGTSAPLDSFVSDYHALKTRIDGRMETIRTRAEYEKVQADFKTAGNQLLQKYAAMPGDDATDLDKAQLNLELGNFAAAEQIAARLIAAHGSQSAAAAALNMKISEERRKDALEQKRIALNGKPAGLIAGDVWINSAALSLRALKGKVIILDFWSPRCGPCRRALPTLVKAYAQWRDSGLVIIGCSQLSGDYADDLGSKGRVTPADEVELTRSFAARFHIAYPLAIAKNDAVFNAYGVVGTPTLIFIDRHGIVVDSEFGFIPADAELLLAKIKALIE
jgi:thiol-disulfide isomerase/thioredoxin